MTDANLSPAKDAHGANNPGAVAERHAYVEGGQLFIMDGGRYVAASRWEAVGILCEIHNSPFASTQERARQIRAAMDEAYPQELAA